MDDGRHSVSVSNRDKVNDKVNDEEKRPASIGGVAMLFVHDSAGLPGGGSFAMMPGMPLAAIIARHSTRHDAGIFRPIPLRVRGRLYVSPMPFGAYDTRNRVLKLYREHQIGHVFMLATDDEIRRKAKRDLKREYEKIGATWSQFAVPDMTAPDVLLLRQFVELAVEKLACQRVAVHCHAGVGRTSVFTCCIVQAVAGLAADDSMAFVKKHMEVNMTPEQMSVVRRFGETG